MVHSFGHLIRLTGGFLTPKLYPTQLHKQSFAFKCSVENQPAKEKQQKLDCFSQFKPLSATRFSAVTHVIFDLDGVVLDTVKYYDEAHRKYLSRFKRKYTPEMKAFAIGIHDIDAAKYLIDKNDLPIKPEVYVHGIWQDLRLNFNGAKLKEGARDLICHLAEINIPIALITSSNKKSFELKMKNHGDILKNFCHIVLGDDPEVINGKPHPDIFNVAKNRFNFKATSLKRYLVIEDSIVGVDAAKAAGMQNVLIADRTIPKQFIASAQLIVNDLKELDLRDFNLPRIPEGKRF